MDIKHCGILTYTSAYYCSTCLTSQFVPRIKATKHPAGKYRYKQLHAVTAAGQRGETTL